jgi:hypothetical protein
LRNSQFIRPTLIAPDLPLDTSAGRARVEQLVDDWIEQHANASAI